MSKTVIKDVTFNLEWFKKVDLQKAVNTLDGHHPKNTIIKVWKIANGLSVPNNHNGVDPPETGENE